MASATRVDAVALETALATMRLTEDNKRRVRAVLVHGQAMREVARDERVSPELVSSAVRRVRRQLGGHLNAWAYVTVPLTLPLTLAEELRGLSSALEAMQDVERARAILHDVNKAVVLAKTRAM